MHESPPQRVKPLYRGTQIVWYVLTVLEVLLAFRFVLRLIGANPVAGFTDFIYSISYPFAAPFLAVVDQSRIGGSVFEWTTLLAMVVYWLVAKGIVRLLVMGKPVSRTEADYKLDEEERKEQS